MSTTATPDLVTVVIATYNMGHYLPQAVQSVLNQTYPHVEVQIVDDGSTDSTTEVTGELSRDPRVRVFRQDNAGQTKAKNAGIVRARGEYIAFLDADDDWLPDKLMKQLPLFRDRPQLGVVYSDCLCMDDKGASLPKDPTVMYRGRISGRLLIENFVCFPTAVVRRRCLDELGAFDEKYAMGIDYELWLRLSASYEFDYLPDPTVRYRIWGGQMSKNYQRRYESAIKIMQSFLDAHPGVVDEATVRQAWAHTYTGRGNASLWKGNDWSAALADYFKALKFQPLYYPAWRSLLRSFVTRRAP